MTMLTTLRTLSTNDGRLYFNCSPPARSGRSWVRGLTLTLLATAALLAAAPSADAKRSAADQALYEKARKECNNFRKYPDGARPIINYKGGWFRCQEPKFRRD
jgi:hypothetical protein